jgi:hypothetical protein
MAETPRVVVRTCATYPEAQRVVDHLSDNDFPVASLQIIGSDLQMVETVTGRMSYGKAAGAGMVTGAWFGLLIGMIVGLFANGDGSPGWLTLVVWGLLWGAAFGIVYGLLAHAATRGRRDFTSRSRIEATHYDVTSTADQAEAARAALVSMSVG